MDTRYTGEMLKHLEKQNELLIDAYRSISHELHKVQVEEEMLMRKFYELMSAQGLTKKSEDCAPLQNEDCDNVSDDGENRHSRALITTTSNGE